MPRDKNRLKLLGSLTVLAAVLIIAAIAQYGRGQQAGQTSVAASTPNPQPRAVFGEGPLPRVTASTPQKPSLPEIEQERESTRSRVTDSGKNLAEIHSLLNRWRTSTIDGNVDAQTILYAPRMEHFFRQRNVSRQIVRREKARMKELYPTINRYDISDVRIESAAKNQAVVTFRKDWDMRGQRRFAGAERQRLKLRRMAGDWKIVSEEETKVFWVNRS
jgi:hypothetical protein